MASELDRLIKHIEELREEMRILAKTKGFADPEVITASQMLDAILNEYHRILKKKNEE